MLLYHVTVSGRQFHRAADGGPRCIWCGFRLELLRTTDDVGSGQWVVGRMHPSNGKYGTERLDSCVQFLCVAFRKNKNVVTITLTFVHVCDITSKSFFKEINP